MKIRIPFWIPMLLSLGALGCNQRASVGPHALEVGRPDTAWKVNRRYDGEGMTSSPSARLADRAPIDLNFHQVPVDRVIAEMGNLFNCRISLTPAANTFIASRRPKVTARARQIPAPLAFEVMRGHIEAQGLTLQEAPNASTFGKAHFLVDVSARREASVAAH